MAGATPIAIYTTAVVMATTRYVRRLPCVSSSRHHLPRRSIVKQERWRCCVHCLVPTSWSELYKRQRGVMRVIIPTHQGRANKGARRSLNDIRSNRWRQSARAGLAQPLHSLERCKRELLKQGCGTYLRGDYEEELRMMYLNR